jgi:hypothetical protein
MALKVTELSPIRLRGEESCRRAIRLAESIGFDEEKRSKIARVVAETATDPTARRGDAPTIRLGVTKGERGGQGLLILSERRSPGPTDSERVLPFLSPSTAGAIEERFAVVQRHSDEFSLHTETGPGRSFAETLIFARFWEDPPSPARHFECEALTQVRSGEIHNGDGIFLSETGEELQAAIIDGLGHGLGARKAAEAAKEILKEGTRLPLAALFERLHRELRGTRGAVVGILRLNRKEEKGIFAGVGNIDCRIDGANPSRPVSMDGSLGVVLPRCREQSFSFGPNDYFVLASDGLSPKWEPRADARWALFPPLVRGTLLLRDHGRAEDDATVLIGRRAPG